MDNYVDPIKELVAFNYCYDTWDIAIEYGRDVENFYSDDYEQ